MGFYSPPNSHSHHRYLHRSRRARLAGPLERSSKLARLVAVVRRRPFC